MIDHADIRKAGSYSNDSIKLKRIIVSTFIRLSTLLSNHETTVNSRYNQTKCEKANSIRTTSLLHLVVLSGSETKDS